MGLVFRGHRADGGEVVAVKILRPELSRDEIYRQRFQREVRVASKVEHPNLVRIIDASRDGGLEYIVVEYFAGGTLDDLLARDEPIPVEDIVRFSRDIAGALVI